MAALPYMQLYIADYLADTMHLSTEEHGAYLLLIFNYWQTGRPIPKNRLAKIARLSAERWSVVEPALVEFFEDDGESWLHLRIERDIEKIGAASLGQYVGSSTGHRGYLYFISSPGSELLKIGFSKNPWSRVKELRRKYDRSYDVVATIKIVVKPENTIDEIFSTFTKKGDWFVKNERLELLINEIKSGNITTVAATHNYVSSYVVAANVATTPTTNKDKDKDLKHKKHMSGSEKKPNQTDPPGEKKYPDDFEELWREYPRRSGSAGKAGALKAWQARRRDGIPHKTMLIAVRRYAAYCAAKRIVGTEFVKMAQTFLGANHEFDNAWLIEPENENSGGRYVPGNGESLAEQQLRAGREQWLREQQEQYERSGYAGVAAVGFDDKNLFEPLDHEKREPPE